MTATMHGIRRQEAEDEGFRPVRATSRDSASKSCNGGRAAVKKNPLLGGDHGWDPPAVS